MCLKPGSGISLVEKPAGKYYWRVIFLESTFADATLASRTERREAQRRGRTHTLATLPAKRQAAIEQYSQLRPIKRPRVKTAPADIAFVPIGSLDALKRRRIEIQSR